MPEQYKFASKVFLNSLVLLPITHAKKAFIAALVVLCNISLTCGQNNIDQYTSLLNVFIDCGDCDMDNIRRKIDFINYVRDRKQADIHILVTEQNTGGGGDAYKMNFIGLDAFSTINYTLQYNVPPTATEFEADEGISRKIKSGLVPFVSETPLSSNIGITVDQESTSSINTNNTREDPWNNWVFEIELGGFIDSEERQDEISIDAEFSADRVTELWRIRNEIDMDFNREAFDTDDGTVVSLNEEYAYDGSVVRSLTNHWSVGFFGSVSSNTFNNTYFSLQGGPAIEWNFYPYKVSDRKEFTIAYHIGGRYNDYIDSTFYDKTKEYLTEHALIGQFNLTEPWGEVELELEGANFLKNINFYSVEFEGEFSLRLVEGLTLDFGGNIELINDQIHLPKEGATKEDIILKRRELITSYRFRAYAGISYTFGSIYNNVVNNRL